VSDNDDHLANLSDGAGCAEVWEHLSAQRAAEAGETDAADSEEREGVDTERDTAENEMTETNTAGDDTAEAADDTAEAADDTAEAADDAAESDGQKAAVLSP